MTNYRFRSILNLKQFEEATYPLRVGPADVFEKKDQMILRMLVQSPYSKGLQLPPEIEYLRSAIAQAESFQREVPGIRHPYTYVTVRSGPVTSTNDDVWHVDGFSTKYNHLPESNYVFTSGSHPTQYLDQEFKFPSNFDPLKHNVHRFLQTHADESRIREFKLNTMYFMDPYVVHRRPPGSFGVNRSFVRISFTPLEIPDINNTINPLITTMHYTTDGVKEFRDKLIDY